MLFMLLGAALSMTKTQTLETQAFRETSDGRVARCEIGFITLGPDRLEGSERAIGTRGNFGMMLLPNGIPFEWIKLTYQDVDGDRVAPDRTPWAVSLIGRNGEADINDRHTGAGIVGATYIFGKDDGALDAITSSGHLRFGFTKVEGYADNFIDVDLNVLNSDGLNEKRGNETLRSFMVCERELLLESQRHLSSESSVKPR